MTIMKLSIWKNSLLVAAFILLEVSGIGPIAKYRIGECYALFSGTGAPVFWLVVYTLFFLIWPIVDLLAAIVKPRVTINNCGVPQ